MTRRKGAFHTEEVGFRCVGVPALGGASRDCEALYKGCDGVAAVDISHSLLGRPNCFATLSCQFCRLVRTNAVVLLSKFDIFGYYPLLWLFFTPSDHSVDNGFDAKGAKYDCEGKW
jgi:hypothetical protein